jgi:hypothetical protein
MPHDGRATDRAEALGITMTQRLAMGVISDHANAVSLGESET